MSIKQDSLVKFSRNQISEFEERKRARFVNGLTGFKSCNLLGSVDEKGNTNLAIISSAFHLGANPALIGFIIRPDSTRRDTLENLRNTKICTFNHVNENIVTQAHQTSARFDQDLSEFNECSLTVEYRDKFRAPFVKESNIKISLQMVNEIKISENNTNLIIAMINDVYLPENILSEDGFIDILQAGTVAVSGLDSYHSTKSIGRLSYAKPGKKPKWI